MLLSFNREHGHPTNVRPLFIHNKKCNWYLGIAILMFVLFAGLANRIQNNGIGAGSFL
jgi:hypothetical protein